MSFAQDDNNLAYTIAGIGRKKDPYAERRTMAQRLIVQGMDTSPVQSPWQGVARLAQAAMGGLDSYMADRDEKKATEDRSTKLAGVIAKMKTDPEGGLAELSAIDPEMGARSAAQMAVERMKFNNQREANQGAGAALGAAYGMAPPGGGMPPQGPAAPAMAPEQAKAAAQQKIQYLVNMHGFTPEQAATMVGNLYQESGFNPTATHDGGTGYGLGGWRLERRDALIKEARAKGEDPANPTTQLDFYANEFKTRPEFQKFQQAQTPEQRQAAMMDYFRPAGYTPQNPQGGHAFANRMQYGQQFGQGAQPQQQPGQPQPLQVNITPNGMPQGDNIGMPPSPSPRGINGPTMMADGSGTAIPPAQPQRAPEIPRPAADPAVVQRVIALRSAGQMTTAEADRAINDDINRRWQHAQTQAAEDRRQQLQIQTEDRRQQGALDRSGAEAFIKGTADRYIKDVRPKAENAVSEINNIHQIRQLLDAGAITGTGADARLFTSKLGELLGIPSEQAANTQVLQSALAARVLSGMGGSLGAGFSNADRDFVERAKGGQITMTEPALRRLIDIGERQSRMVIDAHGKEVSRLNTIPSLSTMGKEFFTLPPVQDYATWREANPLAPVMPPPAGSAPQGSNSALPPPPPGFRMIR
jgi:hypothetical protein